MPGGKHTVRDIVLGATSVIVVAAYSTAVVAWPGETGTAPV